MLRSVLTALCALLMFAAFPIEVQATDAVFHGLTHDKLEGKCGEAGGVFSEDSVGYDCTVANCDGKGGTCSITCTPDSECAGSSPDVVTGPTVTLKGFLHPGDSAAPAHTAAATDDNSGGSGNSGSSGNSGGSTTAPPTNSGGGGKHLPTPPSHPILQ